MVHTFSRPPGRIKRIGRATGGLTLGLAMLALAQNSLQSPDGAIGLAFTAVASSLSLTILGRKLPEFWRQLFRQLAAPHEPPTVERVRV